MFHGVPVTSLQTNLPRLRLNDLCLFGHCRDWIACSTSECDRNLDTYKIHGHSFLFYSSWICLGYPLFLPIFACWSSPIFWCFRHGVSSVSRPLPWPLVATTHIATDGSVVGIGEDPAPRDWDQSIINFLSTMGPDYGTRLLDHIGTRSGKCPYFFITAESHPKKKYTPKVRNMWFHLLTLGFSGVSKILAGRPGRDTFGSWLGENDGKSSRNNVPSGKRLHNYMENHHMGKSTYINGHFQ